ncbi:MAG: response regulator transcription factor [Oxalobacteraceae bacterium]|nr:MAG: response regulator transcription factor [Oxalobacteraceae bacterium]
MRIGNNVQKRAGGQSITVVLASKLTVLREGMKRILLPQDDIDVIAEVDHAREVLFNETFLQADVIVAVVDPIMNGGNDFLLLLPRQSPLLRVIIITRAPTVAQILAILRAGVRGVLDTSCAANNLPAAIRAVSSGRLYMHEEVSRLVAADISGFGKDHTHTALTQRELDVLMKLAAGHKVSEIAVELGISIKTVSTHKARLMEKMGFTTLSQVIQYAIANRLFDTVPVN